MTTLAPSFSIGFSSFLEVTRITIKSRIYSKFGKIPPGNAELAALVSLEKYPETLNGENGALIFGWIFFILAGKTDNYRSLDEFEFQLDPITYYTVSCPLAS